ncbi:MAG: nicotinate-nucleotide--dimethylbenzimidazole phosphoribosyltransferase [Candidatus Latescibacteria bacterium]|nr:nicotinate-nucleotide--dimethylbenzimidazole phosphoribosyltransferase [Candidatus Latescibacterota bacterium]
MEAACRRIQPVDEAGLAATRARQRTLTKPPGSLGQLEEIGNRIVAIRGRTMPHPMRKRIYVVAADHGVTAEGVSAYPREVTYQMVFNFLRGGAAINVLTRHGHIDVQVVDAGVDYDFPPHDRLLSMKIVRGTANFTEGPALTREQAERSVAVGIDLARAATGDGIGLLGIGEMGIGNTTAASAITTVLTDSLPNEVTGRGTGIDDASLARKITVIERAIELNRPNKKDPLDILAKVGGAEIGVMMGLVIGAAAERLPIVADGFISTAAAALAVASCSCIRDYLFIAHLSEEPGHTALVRSINLRPLLDLGMRLGEGTGAALAMHIIEAATKLLSEMATFDEAGVSQKEP